MDYFADIDMDFVPVPAPVERQELTEDDILRMASWTRPFPLPDYLVPTEEGSLCAVPDDVFLTAPPQLIVHLQRCAAQGGLQIVSPRQTPITRLMTRTVGPKRSLGDHVVGAIGGTSDEWPTIDDADFDHLLPDEPLPMLVTETGLRAKTKTEPITKAGHLLSDPILSCLIKGRAVIDVLRRDDVAGNADAMTTLLAEAWGLSEEEIADLDAFTLGIDGPLLRHAIKADEVYPMVHAPIHVKRCISVGASEINRGLLPPDTAMDWRRMRVFCEAVFLLMCSVESIPVKYAIAHPPPGDPTAPLDRHHILAFRPAPCVAWTFEPGSFSIYPEMGPKTNKVKDIPPEVLMSLNKYLEVVKPMSYVIAGGHKARTKTSVVVKVGAPIGETITQSYKMLLRTMEVGMVRGKNSARAVRNAIFEVLEGADIATRLRIARYIKIARTECEIHLGMTDVPDVLIEKIASKFLHVGELIRLKVISEANRRGHSKEDWWNDIIAQAPAKYKALTEGTMGWAKVGMWLAFKSPIDRWRKLVSAVNYRALRDASKTEVGGIALPPGYGTTERLMAVSRAIVSRVSKNFSGYYMAVADVGLSLADVADGMGRARTADRLREGAFLWVLRARSLRGTNVNPIAKDRIEPSTNHIRVKAHPHDLLIVPAPYRAFEAYGRHIEKSELIAPSVKKTYSAGMREKVRKSDIFRDIDRSILPGAESVVTRYLVKPHELASSMEKAWTQIKEDVAYGVRVYANEAEVKKTPKRPTESHPMIVIPIPKIPKFDRPPGKSYFELLGDLTVDEVDWIEDALLRAGEDIAMEFEESYFADAPAMKRAMFKILEDKEKILVPALEAVR